VGLLDFRIERWNIGGRSLLVPSIPRTHAAMLCRIALPPQWVDASKLETAISNGGHPHGAGVYEVLIRFPVGCKLMIDAAIRLLSLVKPTCPYDPPRPARLRGGRDRHYGLLKPRRVLRPPRHNRRRHDTPAYSGATIYRGGNAGLVEIARINKDVRDDQLPTRLTEALMRSCGRAPMPHSSEVPPGPSSPS
jgi:hypothetical protein